MRDLTRPETEGKENTSYDRKNNSRAAAVPAEVATRSLPRRRSHRKIYVIILGKPIN